MGATLVLTNTDGTVLACATVLDIYEDYHMSLATFDHLYESFGIYGSVLMFQTQGRLKMMTNLKKTAQYADDMVHW